MEDSEFNVQVLAQHRNRLYKKQVWLESALVKLVKTRGKIQNQITTLKSKESPPKPQQSSTPLQFNPRTSKVLQKYYQQVDRSAAIKKREDVGSKISSLKFGAKNKRKRPEEDGDKEKKEEQVRDVAQPSTSSSKRSKLISPTKFFTLWNELDKKPIARSIDMVKSKSKKGGPSGKSMIKIDDDDDLEGMYQPSPKLPVLLQTADLYSFCQQYDENGTNVNSIRVDLKYPTVTFKDTVIAYVHHMRQKKACDTIYQEFLTDICERHRKRRRAKAKRKLLPSSRPLSL